MLLRKMDILLIDVLGLSSDGIRILSSELQVQHLWFSVDPGLFQDSSSISLAVS